MRCKPCSEQRGYPYKRGHLVLRRSKVTTKDDGDPWYPGDQRDRGLVYRALTPLLIFWFPFEGRQAVVGTLPTTLGGVFPPTTISAIRIRSTGLGQVVGSESARLSARSPMRVSGIGPLPGSGVGSSASAGLLEAAAGLFGSYCTKILGSPGDPRDGTGSCRIED